MKTTLESLEEEDVDDLLGPELESQDGDRIGRASKDEQELKFDAWLQEVLGEEGNHKGEGGMPESKRTNIELSKVER